MSKFSNSFRASLNCHFVVPMHRLQLADVGIRAPLLLVGLILNVCSRFVCQRKEAEPFGSASRELTNCLRNYGVLCTL